MVRQSGAGNPAGQPQRVFEAALEEHAAAAAGPKEVPLLRAFDTGRPLLSGVISPFAEIVCNLRSNCHQFTHAGSGRVESNAGHRNGEAEISVSDSGRGSSLNL